MPNMALLSIRVTLWRRLSRILVMVLATVVARAQDQPAARPVRPPHRWVYQPAGKLPDGVTHHTFRSKAMGIDVGYCIYLPPAYDRDPAMRFPVVYWHHGGLGNELSGMRDVAPVFSRAIAAGEVPPMIIVYDNGGPAGHYDAPGPQSLGETAFITELIPEIDHTYRTIADRDHRSLEGMSLGGRAATRDLFKHPELFCSAVIIGGGYAVEQKALDAGQSLENNVFLLAKHYAAHPVPPVHLLLIVGTKDYNYEGHLAFMKFLGGLGIAFEQKIVDGATHTYPAYYGTLGAFTLKFHAEQFKASAGH